MMRNVYETRQPYGAGTTYGRELVVIDISDAFMALGVHPDEHPHTVAELGRRRAVPLRCPLVRLQDGSPAMVKGCCYVVENGAVFLSRA